MTEIHYKKIVLLPKPMTGLEIKAALEKSADKNFRVERSKEEGCLLIGAQPSRYPYGLAVYSDENCVLLVEGNTYQQIVVQSNNGWGGTVFAVRRSAGDIIDFCEKTVESFLKSLN